MELLQLNSNMP